MKKQKTVMEIMLLLKLKIPSLLFIPISAPIYLLFRRRGEDEGLRLKISVNQSFSEIAFPPLFPNAIISDGDEIELMPTSLR